MNTIIDFEKAKSLKEKGFDEITDYNYSEVYGYIENINRLKHSDGNNRFISAPTIAEVCMWLYEKHGIWVQSPFSHNDFKPFCWVITTTKRNLSEEEENRNCWLSGIDSEDIDGWDSPTEAYSEAILYTLKNLI